MLMLDLISLNKEAGYYKWCLYCGCGTDGNYKCLDCAQTNPEAIVTILTNRVATLDRDIAQINKYQQWQRDDNNDLSIPIRCAADSARHLYEDTYTLIQGHTQDHEVKQLVLRMATQIAIINGLTRSN